MSKFDDESDDYDLLCVTDTAMAWGVREDEDGELIWLPKSVVEEP